MPPVPYAIFGGQGGGDVVADYLDRLPESATVLGFLNDGAAADTRIRGRRVLGGFADWRSLPEATRFLAPLHKVKEIQARQAVVDGLDLPSHRWGQAIHPQAVVSPRASLGAGVCIGPLCDIGPGVSIGRHVALRGGVSLAHDAVVGDYAFFGAKSVALGYVHVGEGAHIGPGAILREGVRIGRYTVVGLGSIVLGDVEDFAIVAGTPARVIGRVAPATAG